jgi:hypothetical protein
MARRRKKLPLKIMLPLLAWDLAWRALAIRRAWQLDDRKKIAGLAFANTMGVWPMIYLWQNRGR